jgi:hypothetical protein
MENPLISPIALWIVSDICNVVVIRALLFVGVVAPVIWHDCAAHRAKWYSLEIVYLVIYMILFGKRTHS